MCVDMCLHIQTGRSKSVPSRNGQAEMKAAFLVQVACIQLSTDVVIKHNRILFELKRAYSRTLGN